MVEDIFVQLRKTHTVTTTEVIKHTIADLKHIDLMCFENTSKATQKLSRPPLGPRATSRHAITLGSKPVGPINWLPLESQPPPSDPLGTACIGSIPTPWSCGYELHNCGGKREDHIIGMQGISSPQSYHH